MKKFCGALAAASLVTSGLASTASASVIDVDNLLVGDTGNGALGVSAQSANLPGAIITGQVYQTWTVGTSGRLAQINLFGGVGSAYSDDGTIYTGGPPFPFDVTLTILGGGTATAPGDVVLGSVTKSANDIVNNGVTSFDFSGLNIAATAGTLLTWRMSVEDCPALYCVQQWANWNDFGALGNTNGYAGGGVFAFANGVLYNYGHLDLNFRTSVAVPEPASWALLILGFMGVGAALRRRRTVAA